jgi:hypothetical protein
VWVDPGRPGGKLNLRNSQELSYICDTKMLSPVPSLQLLLSDDLTQPSLEQSRLDRITAKKCRIAKPETGAKINVSCVNCDSEEERDWQGQIIGNGITGSLNAFFTRIRHKNKLLKRDTPLMKLLTICDTCCTELNWDGKPNRDHILSVGNINKILASLVLGISYKEVEAVVSSKAIIMEGVAMSAIKTVGIDGVLKVWFLLNKP